MVSGDVQNFLPSASCVCDDVPAVPLPVMQNSDASGSRGQSGGVGNCEQRRKVHRDDNAPGRFCGHQTYRFMVEPLGVRATLQSLHLLFQLPGLT